MGTQPGRSVTVSPERLAGWLEAFAKTHGTPRLTRSPGRIELIAPDGATAGFDLCWGEVTGEDPLAQAVAQLVAPRRVGALIVRRRGHAVGVFEGERLITGRHRSHYAQSRTSAGGWSQKRYARRRDAQAARTVASAAADAAEVLIPRLDQLEALILGGDRLLTAEVLATRGLEPLTDPALRRGLGVFPVPDPNASVLAGFPKVYRRVRIAISE